MKKFWIFLMLVGPLLSAQERVKTIRGQVTDGRAPLADVAISVEDGGAKTFSDADGRYAIEAAPGDVLLYTYQGMKPLRIRVEDVTRILNPSMAMDVAELEEVVVIGSNRKTQRELAIEYPINERLIRTAYGILNADTAPGNIRFMTEEEITPIFVCILDLLRNRFSGVRVVGDCTGAGGSTALEGQLTNIQGVPQSDSDSFSEFQNLSPQRVFIRGASSIFNQRAAIFDVDGQIFSDPPLWLDINQIKRLAILNNFATSTMYGNLGAGGVIVINTLAGAPKGGKLIDQARLRNNYLSGPVLSPGDVAGSQPTYYRELVEAPSPEAAREVYETYASRYSRSAYFILDAYRHFYEVRKDADFADDIITSHGYVFQKNPVLLKALAYTYESQSRLEKAHEVYKKIMRLRPNYGQSYMDLANSYRQLGQYEKAAAQYKRYDYLVEEGMIPVDSASFVPILNREYNNLLYLHAPALVSVANRQSLFVEEEDFQGTRLVFEWNDGEAEFDLQFVNPDRQYHLWKHTLASNADLIMKEKEIGFNTQEFLIDGSLPGTWQVNIRYQGNKSLTPTYLKVSIYDNYGTRSQRKEVRVFKLFLKDVNQQLFTISRGATVALN
ncbi:MAG: carboxypeptidase-like regulatory domain-containing protein [Robiginitalea sp.]